MTCVISQSLGLDVVNINVNAKFYQNIPNGLDLSTFFTNRPVTKSSQTVRWQNQMFDFRALYESQPSVSVDFLRVVQYKQSVNQLGWKARTTWQIKRYVWAFIIVQLHRVQRSIVEVPIQTIGCLRALRIEFLTTLIGLPETDCLAHD